MAKKNIIKEKQKRFVVSSDIGETLKDKLTEFADFNEWSESKVIKKALEKYLKTK
jgi:uncharacterized membrane protein